MYCVSQVQRLKYQAPMGTPSANGASNAFAAWATDANAGCVTLCQAPVIARHIRSVMFLVAAAGWRPSERYKRPLVCSSSASPPCCPRSPGPRAHPPCLRGGRGQVRSSAAVPVHNLQGRVDFAQSAQSTTRSTWPKIRLRQPPPRTEY
jgi:hypothetical protein